MSSPHKHILTFTTNHLVIKCERYLKKLDIQASPRETPKALSHECGICLELEHEKIEDLIRELSAQNIEIARNFPLLNSDDSS